MNSTQDTHDHDQQRVEGEQATGIGGKDGQGRSSRGVSHDPKNNHPISTYPQHNHNWVRIWLD